ncbi:cell division protein FtsA [Candidatus Pelagibacter sp. Uisw_113]|uniref:cell division protein FtsA n=1 Tax=Candidatus Pelagibacter sp. Uisw_113 TaxID=3230994 RepID=UPI0039E80E86
MNNKNLKIYFDCGSSKIRAGVFNGDDKEGSFYYESKFFEDDSNLEKEIKKIIGSLEKDTNEYIDSINLMLDSPKILSIGISVSRKLNGSSLKETSIKFLAQEAKQQILKYYPNHDIAHIIINNYKIDGVDYSYLPDEIKCNFISLDVFFICLPSNLVLYFKNIFSKSNISVDQIICSSYAKSINYKDNLNLTGYTSFIDVGFNKTSITSYFNDKILSWEGLSIGGNNITKDISKILAIDLKKSEDLKLNFNQNNITLTNNFSFEMLQKIIFSRTEEILELSTKSIKSNLFTTSEFNIVLMGDGSKILDNQYTNQIDFSKDINFLEETTKDICQSGFNLVTRLNKQEVIVVPKKKTKQGFFEKLFHFFK